MKIRAWGLFDLQLATLKVKIQHFVFKIRWLFVPPAGVVLQNSMSEGNKIGPYYSLCVNILHPNQTVCMYVIFWPTSLKSTTKIMAKSTIYRKVCTNYIPLWDYSHICFLFPLILLFYWNPGHSYGCINLTLAPHVVECMEDKSTRQ